jgi:hypothetical protein
MPGLTNRGSARLEEKVLTAVWRDKDAASCTLSTWSAALIMASSATPTADTNIISELTEASGNGYARVSVPISASGWTAITEDDTNDKAVATLQDCSYSATPGSIGPVRYLVIVDVTNTYGAGSASAQVIFCFGMAADVTINAGTTVIFQNGKFELRNTSW